MLPLALAFVDIALHRRGPDTLPASQFLLGLVVAAYLAAAYLANAVTPPLPEENAGAELALEYVPLLIPLESVIYAGFIWLLLKSFKRDRRFLQTVTALFGTDTLFTLMSVPILAWAGALGSANATPPTLLYWALLLWSIDVSGFVVSRAIERPYILGVMIVIGYVLFIVSLRATIFGTGT